MAMQNFVACVLLSLCITVALAVEPSDCPNCIIVNLTAGQDTPKCVQGLSSSPCQTLSYVFSNSSSLDHKQVVLQGPQTITHTLTVSQVKDLTIWGNGNIINCSISEGTVSGIVFESVTSLKVVGVVFEGCGAWHNSTERGSSAVQFIHCSWTGNTAFSGAALALYPSNTISTVPTATLESCSISGNLLPDKAVYLHQVLITISGIVDIKIFDLSISGNTSFTNNKGTPMYAAVAKITILNDSLVQFVNNSAVDGGGMALYTYSRLQLSPGCKVLFDSNIASRLGGAIYATSFYIPEFNYVPLCFISYISSENVKSSEIHFTNNTARYGHSIFTTTLLPCLQQISGIGTSSFHWEGLWFSNVQEHTISTGTPVISFTLPKDIAPGERVNLDLMTLDDLNQTVSSVVQVAITVGSGGQARTNPFIPDNGHLQVWGTPGTEFNLTLYVQYFGHVSLTKPGLLGDCPLGLTLEGEECKCSLSTPGKHLVGVVECDMSNFQAHIQIGFWIGCTPANKVITGYCPPGYCNYNNISVNRQSVPRSCNALDEPSVLCVEHRRGVLCGECEDGYSVYFHSDNFGCGECRNGAVGLVYYVLAELFPLVVLFVMIMVMKLKMTSGLMQSLLLFGQTVTFTNISLSPTLQSQTGQTLVRIHTFLLGFLNLDFFRLNELSFCLWSGATVLDNLAFRYVTTLFAILLLVVFVFIVKQSSSAPGRVLTERFKYVGKLKIGAGQWQFSNQAIVHGISTFLILSYSQYTSISIQILSHLPLYGEGGINVGSVVRLQGSVESFGPDHLPYAIPALLVLIFFSLPPPLLLISYPLLWNIKAKLRQNKDNQEDKTPWLIRKLLPLIDSFQGVFRDNRRMFAGLLFLWRVMLATTFASAPNLTSFFFITEAILLVIFTIHVLARPYKRRIYNYIDTVMVANLAIINLLSWYICIITSEGGGLVVVAVAIKLVLMYTPLLVDHLGQHLESTKSSYTDGGLPVSLFNVWLVDSIAVHSSPVHSLYHLSHLSCISVFTDDGGRPYGCRNV